MAEKIQFHLFIIRKCICAQDLPFVRPFIRPFICAYIFARWFFYLFFWNIAKKVVHKKFAPTTAQSIDKYGENINRIESSSELNYRNELIRKNCQSNFFRYTARYTAWKMDADSEKNNKKKKP